MPSKISDKFAFFFTMVIISPLIAAAVISIVIGYTLHRIKNIIIKK